MTFPESDQEIIKYLLHELSEYELSMMEQRAASDSAFFELVASVEDELIMQYVLGDMEQSLKLRFEKAYLHSNERRARIESARRLRDGVRKVANARRKAKSKIFSIPARMWLAAAVLLVAGFTSWLLLRNRESMQNDPGRELVVSLIPGRLRSGPGSEAAQFGLSQSIQRVVFQLALPSNAPLTAYKVVVGTPERPDIFHGNAVVHDGKATVAVPAELITAGDYTLELQGVDPGGASLPVATYYFRSAR